MSSEDDRPLKRARPSKRRLIESEDEDESPFEVGTRVEGRFKGLCLFSFVYFTIYSFLFLFFVLNLYYNRWRWLVSCYNRKDKISKNLCQIRMCSDKGIFQCSKCKLVVCTEHELHGAHRPLPKTKLCAIIDISNTSIPSSIQKEKEESKSENKSVIELDKEEEEEEEEEKEEEEVEEVEGPFILNRSIIPFILNRSIIPITIVIGAKSSNKWDGN